jgi:hypothetical protein
VFSLKLTLNKFLYYRDIRLHFYIFFASVKLPISFFPEQKKGSIHQINQKVRLKRKTEDRDKISRYISLYFRLLGKLGFRNTCLTRSALLCYVLRKYGFNAQMNFGIKTDAYRDHIDPSFLGHCWVSVAHDNLKEPDYETISQYP